MNELISILDVKAFWKGLQSVEFIIISWCVITDCILVYPNQNVKYSFRWRLGRLLPFSMHEG